MLVKPLSILCEDGGLKSPTVIRDTSSDRGYLLHFERRDGRVVYVTTYRSSGESVRVFKTIDAAAQIARSVGFDKVIVDLEGIEDMKRKPKKNPA